MTRIPGAGRSSAPPSLENKEEHERDVAPLSREDRDRWGPKLATREMGAALVPGGGERMVTRGVQASQEGARTAASPPFGSCLLRVGLLSLPHPSSFPEPLSLGGGRGAKRGSPSAPCPVQ